MSSSSATKGIHHVPSLPAYGEYRSVPNEEQDSKAPYTTNNDHRVHECADEKFAELSQGGPV